MNVTSAAARWAPALIAAGAVAVAEWPRPSVLGADLYFEAGEFLIHGLPGMLPFRMPLASVMAAILSSHSLLPDQGVFIMMVAAQSVLLLALCGVLFPAVFLPFAIVLALLSCSQEYPRAYYAETLYSTLILLVAGIMVWRARQPSRGKTMMLALAIGCSFLFRSPLAFFPPLLALYEYAGARRPRSRAALLDAVILCVVPYLFLIPWIRLNWVLFREIVPFEYGAAYSNMVTGALGLVKTVEGPWENLMPPSSGPGGSVFRWAAGEVARNPVRTLAAIAQRAGYVLSLHPFLSFAGLFGLWRGRHDRSFRLLGLLCAYYLGVHCLMTVLPRYFVPLWPLMAILAAGSAMSFLSGDRGSEDVSSERRWAPAVLSASLALLLTLCMYVVWVVAAYAASAALPPSQARERTPALLDRAVASCPEDPWLRLQRGRSREVHGDTSGAADDYSRGLAARPGDPRLSLELAWARALQGQDSALLGWRDSTEAPVDVRIDARLYQAHVSLRLGRDREAREHLLAARRIHDSQVRVNAPVTPRDHEVDVQLRSSDSGFASWAYRRLEHRPEGERLKLLAALEPVAPVAPQFLLERAALAVRAGDRRAADTYMARAGRLNLNFDDSLRHFYLSREMKDHRGALSMVRSILSSRPGDGRLWLERAQVEAMMGDRRAALVSAAHAESLASLDLEHGRRLVALYNGMKEHRRALSAVKILLESHPKEAGLWIERAELELVMGERAAAIQSAARAEGLTALPLMMQRRWFRLHQNKMAPRQALGVLKTLLESAPQDAELWMERAVLEAKTGQRAAALESLSRAEALNPDVRLRRWIVTLYREMKEHLRALPALKALLESLPQDADLWLERAEVELSIGEHAAALVSAARAEELDSLSLNRRRHLFELYRDQKEPRRALGVIASLLERLPHDAELWIERAELEAKTEQKEAALESLSHAEASNPDVRDRRRIIALYRGAKEYRRALAAMTRLLEIFPRDVGLWLDRVELELQAGEWEAGLRSLSRIEELGSAAVVGSHRGAEFNPEHKEYNRALALRAALLRSQHPDVWRWIESAEVSAQAGDRAAALEALARAEGLFPEGSQLDAGLGRRVALVYQSLGDHDRAIAVLERLIRKHPGDGTLHSDKGLCEYLKGDAGAAIVTLETAIRAEPKFLPAYLTLGAIHAAQERPKEALKVYEEGLERGLEADPLRSILLGLRKGLQEAKQR